MIHRARLVQLNVLMDLEIVPRMRTLALKVRSCVLLHCRAIKVPKVDYWRRRRDWKVTNVLLMLLSPVLFKRSCIDACFSEHSQLDVGGFAYCVCFFGLRG